MQGVFENTLSHELHGMLHQGSGDGQVSHASISEGVVDRN